MTANHKLFAAAALVAAGFGIARLMGEPAAKTDAPNDAALRTVASAPLSTIPNGEVRLVPDFNSAGLGKLSKLESAPLLVDAKPANSASNVAEITNASEKPMPNNDSLVFQRPVPSTMKPHVSLRNEAPRPLAIDSAPSTTIDWTTLQPAATANATMLETSVTSPSWPSAPSTWPVGEPSTTGLGKLRESVATIVASYDVPSEPAGEITPIAPPPWPVPEVDGRSRTHIVVDGDSLSRLAGRYLDDPRREAEIFDANRGVLTDPELLPIGAELVIPSRRGVPNVGSEPPQSRLPRTVAVHAPATSGLVPVGPVPSSAGVVPRALLTRPMSVE